MLRIDFVTLFPEMVLGAMGHSMMKRAQEAGLVKVGAVNPRDFTHDNHRTVDDDPYGGGAGMVMMCQPVWDAVASLGIADFGLRIAELEASRHDSEEPGSGTSILRSLPPAGTLQEEGEPPENPQSEIRNPQSSIRNPQSAIPNPQSAIRNPKSAVAIVLPDPTGKLFKQEDAAELSQMERLVFLCGHYEGIDDRIRQSLATHVFSLGDFVLTGGELPALVMADAAVRLIPGVLGCEGSLAQDSHSDGLLSAPQFTRPETFNGLSIPEVLKTGDHGAIAKWRRRQSLIATRTHRPDLFWRAPMEKNDPDMLSS